MPNLRRVYLDQCDLEQSHNPKHWLLALILAETTQLAKLVDRIRSHHADFPKAIDWLDLLETILVYKLPKLTREEIQTMFGFNEIELKQTRFYQQVFGEGRKEGKEEGREEGWEKGMKEGRGAGRVEGEATFLLRLLERRFGALPESARQRIVAADSETLLIWGDRLLEARSLDDIWRA